MEQNHNFLPKYKGFCLRNVEAILDEILLFWQKV
ncbi:hypothetical protein Desca_2545 [Desulfotomaculum nigrificans CO-1-SRB]|uniref:Uncharacterized protein n=1 Tax=Desulfotomaculum nigrificans (strain DSM 14880 / VKM B-2319 / CO-1-SRB) TaxID=868595 RepID=F6B4Z7_DESCC|nr:hypothetical protein Desca_2545 [Desulfotomaculum nigrificans CO-1-SRB]